VPVVSPFRSLNIARSCARIDSRLPTAKTCSNGRVDVDLTAERDLVAAVDADGGAVPLSDGRSVTVGRAEFDALLGERRRRTWVIIRKQVPMPARR
jgi:hypothetical protein